MSDRFIDTYLLSLMAQTSAAISREFHDWLDTQDISVSDWRILASLYPDTALTIGELCEACLAKQSTMTRMVDRMVTQGMVDRTGDTTDRRRVVIQLTPEGRSLASELVAEANAHEARLLSDYSAKDAAALKALLRIVKERASIRTSAATFSDIRSQPDQSDLPAQPRHQGLRRRP